MAQGLPLARARCLCVRRPESPMTTRNLSVKAFTCDCTLHAKLLTRGIAQAFGPKLASWCVFELLLGHSRRVARYGMVL
eukprot:scaffold264431_cov18-Prasinocladus_malaysianus.AAC.1